MSDEPKISRREFLKFATTAAIVAAYKKTGIEQIIDDGSIIKETQESTEAAQERQKHFKPFQQGQVWWQYVAFQYTNKEKERKGVTVSFTEINDNDSKEHKLLVMHHDLAEGTTLKKQYQGKLIFNEETSTYTFEDEKGKRIATYSYDIQNDRYTLHVHTEEFNTDNIDKEGVILLPQGNLIHVSKDGEFTVARQNNIEIKTKYYADHVRVARASNPTEIIGFGRRDSENLEAHIDWTLKDQENTTTKRDNMSTEIDMDHTWVHCIVELDNDTIACITGWKSTTGGEFKFADIRIINPQTGKVLEERAYNEEDTEFTIEFIKEQTEMEKVGNTIMPHGGIVVAKIGNDILLRFKIDGNAGQIITGKGSFKMTEAHATVTSGEILGHEIRKSESCIYESTEEVFQIHLPYVRKNQ